MEVFVLILVMRAREGLTSRLNQRFELTDKRAGRSSYQRSHLTLNLGATIRPTRLAGGCNRQPSICIQRRIQTNGKIQGREAWSLAVGDVFVIGGPQIHAYRDLDNLRLVNLLFQLEKLLMEKSDLAALPGYHALFTLEPAWRRRHQFQSRLHLAPRNLDAVLALVEQLEEELSNRTPGFAFMGAVIFMQIVGQLSRFYDQGRNPRTQYLPRLAQIITQLKMLPEEAVKLNDLANKAGMSPRSFVRCFRAATGLSPIAYLIQLRITRAAMLLRSTTEPGIEAFGIGETVQFHCNGFNWLDSVFPVGWKTTKRGLHNLANMLNSRKLI